MVLLRVIEDLKWNINLSSFMFCWKNKKMVIEWSNVLYKIVNRWREAPKILLLVIWICSCSMKWRLCSLQLCIGLQHYHQSANIIRENWTYSSPAYELVLSLILYSLKYIFSRLTAKWLNLLLEIVAVKFLWHFAHWFRNCL